MAYIEGSSKFESIYGTKKNDTLDGKGGSDLLRDLYGSNDTYIFNKGYGQPNITDIGGNDTLLFGPGISAGDIKFYLTKNGYLMPRIKDTIDKPEITNWPDAKYQIENWVFQDGTKLTNKQIDKLIDYGTSVIIRTPGNDKLYAGRGNHLIYLMQGNDFVNTTGGNNIIEASSGNDIISNTGKGNDEIYMGTGNDYTEDNGGNDRYIYNKTDGKDIIYDKGGNDTVKFGAGILKNNLLFSRTGNDLAVNFKYRSTDTLTIKNWFSSSNNRIETFELWDGSKYSAQEATNMATGKVTLMLNDEVSVPIPTTSGTDGYNYISGHYDNDVYYLKQGNDRVMDYEGDDVYLFNKGDGRDNITDRNGNDKIIFGEGLSKNDISFSREQNNLIMNIKGTYDSININKWFNNADYQIEKIQFSDGTYFSDSDINKVIQQISSYSATSEPEIISTEASELNLQNITLVPVN